MNSWLSTTQTLMKATNNEMTDLYEYRSNVDVYVDISLRRRPFVGVI